MKKTILALLTVTALYGLDLNQAVEKYEEGSYIQALDAFFRLAKEGNAKAQFNLAMMYEKGEGVRKDLKKAIEWYEKSAQNGYMRAAYNLAVLFQTHPSVDPHALERARFWYDKALEGGIMQAANNLALLYLEGKGGAKDREKALALLEKAAKAKDAEALLNLGIVYAWGEKTLQNRLKAYEYFQKAMQVVPTQAQTYLKRLCRESAWVCEKNETK